MLQWLIDLSEKPDFENPFGVFHHGTNTEAHLKT